MVVSVITWAGCVGYVPGLDQVTVTTAGGGIGVVTSTPNGINCSSLGTGTCQIQFTNAPTVTLTATPTRDSPSAVGRMQSATTTHDLHVSGAANVTATFNGVPEEHQSHHFYRPGEPVV